MIFILILVCLIIIMIAYDFSRLVRIEEKKLITLVEIRDLIKDNNKEKKYEVENRRDES